MLLEGFDRPVSPTPVRSGQQVVVSHDGGSFRLRARLVKGLRPEYGIVVSGHTHRFYSCALPNSSGRNSVVTSAGAWA